MSYYFFNGQEFLRKAKDKCYNCGGKEIAAEYCITHTKMLKNRYKNLLEEESESKRGYGKNRYEKMKDFLLLKNTRGKHHNKKR